MSDSNGGKSLPLPLELRVDAVCEQFEVAWQAGGGPRLEDYLRGAAEPDRRALLAELLRLEVEYRRRRGETPRPDEYRDRFPDRDPQWLAALGGEGLNSVLTGPSPGAAATSAEGAGRPPASEVARSVQRVPG